MECPHEPSADMNDRAEVVQFFDDHNGCADSAMTLWLDEILEKVGPRTLIVERPLAEAERSALKAYPNVLATNVCEIIQRKLDEVGQHPLVLRIPYHKMDDLPTMRRAFWHLRPGVAFDEGRFLKMRNERIVSDCKEVAGRLIVDTITPELRIKNVQLLAS